MLTPIEIQSKNFKSGIGYDRKDVDGFMREVLTGYERIYKENVELKDKINVLNDGIQYYKTIEKTLQKALVLAEQTAEETRQAALKSAKAIENEAQGKADLIIADARNELAHINQMITGLTRQYECYKVQYRQLAASQLDLLQSPTFELTLMNGEQLKTSYTSTVDSNNLSTSAKQDLAESINTTEEINQSTNDSSDNENSIRCQNDETNKINTDNISNIGDSDFTMVEEAASTLEDSTLEGTTNANREKKDSSSESEFEFIDFEVNLD